jgi:hypothetical protein
LGDRKVYLADAGGEPALYYEYERGYKPLRFCVLRKTKEAEEKGLESLRKTLMRKQGDKALGTAL